MFLDQKGRVSPWVYEKKSGHFDNKDAEYKRTWEFNDWDEVSEYAFIELDVEISQKWETETDDNLQPHVLGVRILEDLRLEMQEAINSDLAHYNFWEWKTSNDDSNYTFYHEL